MTPDITDPTAADSPPEAEAPGPPPPPIPLGQFDPFVVGSQMVAGAIHMMQVKPNLVTLDRMIALGHACAELSSALAAIELLKRQAGPQPGQLVVPPGVKLT